jgi:hypothetical protein
MSKYWDSVEEDRRRARHERVYWHVLLVATLALVFFLILRDGLSSTFVRWAIGIAIAVFLVVWTALGHLILWQLEQRWNSVLSRVRSR